MNAFFRRLWAASPSLVIVGVTQLVALVVFAALVFADPRVVNGQLTWIKPAKFAISTALYTLTLAWIATYIDGHRRAVQIASWLTGGVLALEVALIAVQANRGVISHFNVATPFDQTVYNVMAGAVLVAWVSGWTFPVLLVRQKFADLALASALRTGVIISMIGAATAGLMTSPRASQLQALQRGEKVERVGSHAVGVPDGGAGLPVVGWATEGGDLRIAHFAGLHALQAIPLLALWIRRRGARRGTGTLAQRRQVRVAAGGYLGLIGVLVLQALRAEPLLAPSLFTVGLFAALAAVTGVAWLIASRGDARQVQPGAGAIASAA